VRGVEAEDDGRYVKRTCVRVSHQPVSQCVDVTLMQMGLRRKKRKQKLLNLPVWGR